MKNKKGSTLLIVMMAFTLFALLSTGISVLFFLNLRLRIKKIEERASYIELSNAVYQYLNETSESEINETSESEIVEGNEEFSGYTVQVSRSGDNYEIIFQHSENDKIRAEILVRFQGEIYEIYSWRKG